MTQTQCPLFRSILASLQRFWSLALCAEKKNRWMPPKKPPRKQSSDSMVQKLPDREVIMIPNAWRMADRRHRKLHKNIGDDIIVVNGMWAPPVVGWNNYLASYQAQRARTQQIRMDRMNTLIRVNGNTASACYQWDFAAVVDGLQSGARGQTTLLLEKRAEKWIIILNHTSIVDNGSHTTTVSPAQPPAPAKP
jgi:hypothetical protein